MSDEENGLFVEPTPLQEMPPGIPYIVGNEAAERFSFYGMKAILFVYMTKYLINAAGQPDLMEATEARENLHWFVASAYFFPVAGAILSDWLLGKYRTIFWLSLVYCLGHLALATVPGRMGLLMGLTLIAMGAGGIKPCVSAHVGDQFSEHNKHLLPRVFGWFYFSINFGAFFSTIITPLLLEKFGPHWGPHVAFGLPGLLMFLATFVFWLGRKKFVHVKPAGAAFIRESFSDDGLKALASLIPLYLFVTIFWTLYDQTASAWVEQADSMDRQWMGINWLSSQIQAINPILVLVLIPACTYGVYPALNTIFQLTSLRKVAIGFFITAIAFAISALIESNITGGKIVRCGPVALEEGQTEPTGEQEVVVQLRENRAWNVKSVNIQFNHGSELRSENMAEKCQVNIKVQSGASPSGPWSERASLKLDALIDELHSADFSEVTSAAYIRFLISRPEVSPNTSTFAFRVSRNLKPNIKILAAESSPPKDAHPHATSVWPDLAATGYQPNIYWQIVGYFFLTLAEVMVSITCLEFSYTQAPNKMKSLIMSLYLLSVSLGNVITATVNNFIQNKNGTSKLPGASYYWFFTGLMLVAAFGFLYLVATYKEKAYLQTQADAE